MINLLVNLNIFIQRTFLQSFFKYLMLKYINKIFEKGLSYLFFFIIKLKFY